MHRHIEGDDVTEYASGANKKHVQFLKEEDIEYRDGFLYHSSGFTEITIKGQTRDESQHSVSESFAAQGSYTLDLLQCYVPAKHTQSRKRRSMSEEMDRDLTEEDLKVHIDRGKTYSIQTCAFLV